MSPAAAGAAGDFQSPFTVKPSPSANPNSFNPFFSANDRSKNQSQDGATDYTFPSGCNANEIGYGIGKGFVSQNCGKARLGRKPRLVKLRKHAERSTTSATQEGAEVGFNPFQSKCEYSGPVSNCSLSSSLSNNVMSDEASISNAFSFVNNENVGFVFGANMRDVGVDLNFQKRDTNDRTVKFGLDDDLSLNLNLEKEDFGGTLKKPASDPHFSGNQNYMGSSSCVGKSERNGHIGDSCFRFEFGASWCNSSLNVNPHGRNALETNGKTVCDNQGKKELEKTESQKPKVSEARIGSDGDFRWSEDNGEGVFVSVSGKQKSSCFDDCATPDIPIEAKMDSNILKKDNIIGRTDNCNLDFDINKNSNTVSEISSSSNVGSTSSTDPSFKLPDEMQKLNIKESENDHRSDKKYDSNKNTCINADIAFMFSSNVKPSSPFDESLGPAEEHTSSSTADIDRMARDNFSNCNNGRIYQPLLGQAELRKICKVDVGTQANVTAGQDSLPSSGVKSQQNNCGLETPSSVGVQNDESSPTNTQHSLGASFPEFVTPNWDPSCFKATLFPDLNKKLGCSVKTNSLKDKRSKKTRGRSKQPCVKKEVKQVHMPKQSSSLGKSSTPDCYSPMDFSPCMETKVNEQPSQEACATSENFYPDNGFAPSTLHPFVITDAKDENFSSAEKGDADIANQNEESNTESPWKEFIFGSETAYPSFKQEQSQSGCSNAFGSAEHANRINTGSVQRCFAAGVDDLKHFTFSSLSSADGGLTSRKSKLRKRSKKKVVNNSFVISPSLNDKVGFSQQANIPFCKTVDGREEDKHKNNVRNKFEAAEQLEQGPMSFTAAFQETCEVWRLRGNQAYKNSNLTKAEEFYTQGINSVPLSETVGCCIKPLVLCYSNRAATRISLGRIREALEDCVAAARVDPDFHKVYMRAAKCHLVLGELENAVQYYNKLLNSGAGVCLDRRITIEASEGLQKTQKVAECINCSTKLLEQKTSEAVSSALEKINEVLSISSCSEKLLEMKAEALCMLRRYEEAIQLCEQTLCAADKNFDSMVTDNCSMNMESSGNVNYSPAKLWRSHLISKSYFCLGKLEMALDLLQKLKQVGSTRDKYGSEILESSISLAATIRELLHHRSAGNEAVKSGRYTEAVEHYTVALSSNVESRPFAAICFCNRAAAFQALGQIADAIADCSLAMALDGNYAKAVSRRAALHEMIRDYSQAATDLQRLISILESRSAGKAKQSESPGRSTGSKDIRQARRQMSLMEEESKKGDPLNFYLILGVKASDSAADVKKAYRRAALKHHPDKAGHFLVRTESGDEGRLWKEIAHEVDKDADRLFKMIGEAYTALSDPAKRSEFDMEEEIRKARKGSAASSHHRRSSDAYSYSYRRSANGPRSQDNWKTYGNSYSRW